MIGNAFNPRSKKFPFFYLKLILFLIFINNFNVLILKIIFKNKKILIYFYTKNTLNYNHYHNFKQVFILTS